ncbi:DEAD/DEAH box helicase [Bacillus timonensis]|uniref:DEAD/DEAH box helicase n=1 Tax=Bacillus timonensis TaxID=1033734 RepID=A0A4S3PSP1_9BACI|nr:DEAD/DEAH box helicase [Bacillus timonensis]THE12335.1 DEAD/DEAH box helicase [Bacillus timonensis]
MRFLLENNILIPEPLSDKSDAKRITDIESSYPQPLNPTFEYSTELQHLLYGKQLLLDEIPFSLENIHQHYLNGYLQYRRCISKTKDGYSCVRCGNADQKLFASFGCARCKQDCAYCRKCINMGRMSECSVLVSWTGPSPIFEIPEKPLVWEGTLSPGQQRASSELIKAVQTDDQLLIWAVCGAGKTEILFEGIGTALQTGKKVCLATPRTDVVIELAPRIKSAFPEIDVIALYGGSEDRNKTAPITLATTHQLLRFYKAFDMIIIDEVDAFPYSVEPMLQYAVNQAKKDISSTIYLTATPNQTWKKEIQAGKRKAVTIPARYHRHALPVPEFIWCGNWEKILKKKRLPGNVMAWVKNHLEIGKQAFLFVPRITYLENIVKILQTLDARIEGVHAEDPDRKDKVARYRSGEIPILVTTTILERGVTVPNIDVAVLGAEDKIFTESALVQISGRVGRSAKYPTGEILFFHYGRTREMIKAKKHIENMNKEAIQHGFID